MKLFMTLTMPMWGIGGVLLLKFYFRYVQSEYGIMSGVPWYRLIRDKGALGEFYTFEKLERLPGYHHLLTNVYLPRPKGGMTEVDLIFLCESGIFVVESKNYSGWIYGSEKNRYWTQVFPNQHKERFYNPILQNAGHIAALRAITGMESGYFHSLIVFSERCRLKKIEIDSEEIRVIKRNQIGRVMKEERSVREMDLTRKEVDDLYYRTLLQYSHADQNKKEEHIKRLGG